MDETTKMLRNWLGPTHPDLHTEVIFVGADLDRSSLLARLAAPEPYLILSQRDFRQDDSVSHRGLGRLTECLIQHYPAPL